MLPHYDNERQWSVNNLWPCVLGSQGISRMNELIMDLLTASIVKHTTYKRNSMDSIIIDMTNCNTCKKRLLAAEYAILIRYYYQTAKARELYESTDGPVGWPADNAANSDELRDFHWTVPELTVQVNWHPTPPMCQRSRWDPDPDLKRPSRTVANTRCQWSAIAVHISGNAGFNFVLIFPHL